MVSFRTSSFLLLMLCSSQIFCASLSEENVSPADDNELENDEEISPTPEEESEVTESTSVPVVRMPSNGNSKNTPILSDSKTAMKTQKLYTEQTEIWPKKISNPLHDILELKASCRETDLNINLEFSTPFRGYVYPYHHFKRCQLFSGKGEQKVNLQVDKDSCGLDIILESAGDVRFLAFTIMVQWNPDFISQWDRKIRVTCSHRDNDRKDSILFEEYDDDNSTLEAEIRMDVEAETEDESDDSSSLPAAFDLVQVGEQVDITFFVSDRSGEQPVDAQVVQCKAYDGVQSGDAQTIKTYGSETNSEISYDGSHMLLADGCPKDATVFSEFTKEKSKYVVSLTNRFKVFRFPSSAFIFVECDVRVCRGDCPLQQDCSSQLKTVITDDSKNYKKVTLLRPLLVSSPMGGLLITDEHHDDTGKTAVKEGVPTASFIAGLIGMGFVCAIVCVFMYRRFKKGTEKDYKMQYSPNAEKNKDEVAPLKVTTASNE